MLQENLKHAVPESETIAFGELNPRSDPRHGWCSSSHTNSHGDYFHVSITYSRKTFQNFYSLNLNVGAMLKPNIWSTITIFVSIILWYVRYKKNQLLYDERVGRRRWPAPAKSSSPSLLEKVLLSCRLQDSKIKFLPAKLLISDT